MIRSYDKSSRLVVMPSAAVMVTAAALLWHHLPVPTEIFAPFDVHGRLGASVHGDSLTATVTRVRAAATGNFALGRRTSTKVSAIGVWLVVDTTMSANDHSTLPSADLVLGGNTYQPSQRTPAPGFGLRIDPGLPQHGCWTFDVAPELLRPSTTAEPRQLRLWSGGDGRLSSRLVIDLGDVVPQYAGELTVEPYEVDPAA